MGAEVPTHVAFVYPQIVMEFCGAGSVSDLMKIRNKTVSYINFSCHLLLL